MSTSAERTYNRSFLLLSGHGIEFCLNFRAFFYLLIPAVLLKMAARHNWRGIYSDLIPHCVTLSWWQLTLIYAQGTRSIQLFYDEDVGGDSLFLLEKGRGHILKK